MCVFFFNFIKLKFGLQSSKKCGIIQNYIATFCMSRNIDKLKNPIYLKKNNLTFLNAKILKYSL